MDFNKSDKRENDLIDRSRKSQLGFSLLEMVVAMMIFLIVTGTIYGLLQVGRLDRNRSSRRTDIMKNARLAVQLIGRDALNAGLSYHKVGGKVPNGYLSNRYGLLPDTDLDRDILTSIVVGDNLFANDIQEVATIKTDSIGFAYRDVDFNGGNTISLSPPGPGSSPDIARVITTTPGAAAAVNKYDLYMIQTDNTQVVVMVTGKIDNSTIDFAPTDPLGLNQPFNGTGFNKSLLAGATGCVMKRISLVNYKVKQDGTFVRLIYGNNTGQPSDQQIQEQPLAYNVKDMQIRYVLNDGRVMDNPGAGDDGIVGTVDDMMSNTNLITQITVTLKVASLEKDEQTGKPDVITLNATFSTRNLQYDS